MAREQANIGTSLWGDRDWRELPQAAKYLYLMLLSHPSITYAGVVDWRPARLAVFSPDTTAEYIEQAAHVLQEARFIFIDAETEEAVIRSYLRHDGVLKQPKLSVSMANAYAAISSHKIQDVIAFELHRLREDYPDWAAWKSPKVLSILKNVGQDMSAFTLNVAQDLPLPLPLPLGPKVTHSVTQDVSPSQALPTLTATLTTTSVPYGTEVSSRAQDRSTTDGVHPLPKNWMPDPAALQVIRSKRHNVNKIVSGFVQKAEGTMVRDWDAKFADHVRLLKPEPPTVWNTTTPDHTND